MLQNISQQSGHFASSLVILVLFFCIFLFRNNIHDVSDIAIQGCTYFYKDICGHTFVLAEFCQSNRTYPCFKSQFSPRHIFVDKKFPKFFIADFHNSPIKEKRFYNIPKVIYWWQYKKSNGIFIFLNKKHYFYNSPGAFRCSLAAESLNSKCGHAGSE